MKKNEFSEIASNLLIFGSVSVVLAPALRRSAGTLRPARYLRLKPGRQGFVDSVPVGFELTQMGVLRFTTGPRGIQRRFVSALQGLALRDLECRQLPQHPGNVPIDNPQLRPEACHAQLADRHWRSTIGGRNHRPVWTRREPSSEPRQPASLALSTRLEDLGRYGSARRLGNHQIFRHSTLGAPAPLESPEHMLASCCPRCIQGTSRSNCLLQPKWSPIQGTKCTK